MTLFRTLLAFTILLVSFTAGAADISLRFYPPEGAVAHPGSDGWLYAIAFNHTPNERASVDVHITYDPALEILDAGHWMNVWTCDRSPGKLVCRNPDFGMADDGGITLRVRTPPSPQGGEYRFTAEAISTSVDPDLSNNKAESTFQVIRQLIVSNTNDAGEGSLRAAIEGANAWCTETRSCEIKFRFPAGPVPVIEPLSPLPAITACGVLVGDRPAIGARAPIQVEVNGRHVRSGPGLELRSACRIPAPQFFGMAINGFPGDGILITAPTYYLLNGFVISSNGGRGIVMSANLNLALIDAVIGGNARSGIMLNQGSAVIDDSFIGIGRDGREMANGASGIYVAPAATDVFITDTVIANHPHFGVALATGRFVSFTNTVIKDNNLDVDWLLDGPTRNDDADRIPNTPRVLSARYDAAANVTRVTVALEIGATATTNMQVRLYASDRVTLFGTAHLATLAANRWIAWKAPIPETLAFEVPGDLRGKHVSAVTTLWTVQEYIDTPAPAMYSTSETSVALRVE